MNKKLENLTYDLNEFLYENDTLFEEYPLVYNTTGFANSIDINRDTIFPFEDCNNYIEFIQEIREKKELYEKLYNFTKIFFESIINKEIEERYGIGIEENEYN